MAHIQEGVALSKAVVICCCRCHGLPCLRGLSLPVIQPAPDLQHSWRQSANSSRQQKANVSSAALQQSAVRSIVMESGCHLTALAVLQIPRDNLDCATLKLNSQGLPI